MKTLKINKGQVMKLRNFSKILAMSVLVSGSFSSLCLAVDLYNCKVGVTTSITGLKYVGASSVRVAPNDSELAYADFTGGVWDIRRAYLNVKIERTSSESRRRFTRRSI